MKLESSLPVPTRRQCCKALASTSSCARLVRTHQSPSGACRFNAAAPRPTTRICAAASSLPAPPGAAAAPPSEQPAASSADADECAALQHLQQLRSTVLQPQPLVATLARDAKHPREHFAFHSRACVDFASKAKALVVTEHIDGARFCERLFGHFLLPNGRLAHFFHKARCCHCAWWWLGAIELTGCSVLPGGATQLVLAAHMCMRIQIALAVACGVRALAGALQSARTALAAPYVWQNRIKADARRMRHTPRAAPSACCRHRSARCPGPAAARECCRWLCLQ